MHGDGWINVAPASLASAVAHHHKHAVMCVHSRIGGLHVCVRRSGTATGGGGSGGGLPDGGISPTLLRAYIAQAKTYEPTIPEPLTDYIAAV